MASGKTCHTMYLLIFPCTTFSQKYDQQLKRGMVLVAIVRTMDHSPQVTVTSAPVQAK